MTEPASPTEPTPGEPAPICALCKRPTRNESLLFAAVRPQVANFVTALARSPLADDAVICRACLRRARSRYLIERLSEERGTLSALEVEIANKAAAHETVVSHLDEEFRRTTTRGQRLADGVARVGGSWPFVIGFGVFLVIWMIVNAALLGRRAFDPYPFILLNLVLSCLAAIQAPIIMMSQNRASARDRMQADQDFRVNLKAELEVAALHEKLDHLLHARWEDLIEIQEAQLDLLSDLADHDGERRGAEVRP